MRHVYNEQLQNTFYYVHKLKFFTKDLSCNFTFFQNFRFIVAVLASQTKTHRFRENAESLMMSVNNNAVPMFTSEHMNYF